MGSAIIYGLTLFFIAKTYKNSVSQRINSDVVSFLSRCSDEQGKNERDDLRRNAHSIFSGKGSILATNVSIATEAELQTACVNYLGDRLNLIFQAWVISGQNPSFKGPLEGWNTITKQVIINIYRYKGRLSEGKSAVFPDYYCKACEETILYLDKKNFYSHKFLETIEKHWRN